MWHYLYRAADGALVSESEKPIDAPDGFVVKSFDARQGQGGTQWDAATKTFVPASAPRRISPIAFIDRFTVEERIAVRERAKSDPIIEDYLHRLDLKAACDEQIDLDSHNAIGGLGYLESVGLVAAGRAADILA